MYKNLIKPCIDKVVALGVLIVFSPIIFISMLLLAISNNGSVFFRQERPGKNGEIFSVAKFKTMVDRKDRYGNLLPDDERITKVGRFLRKTSIDELPQLINILKGEMSFVGPRPLLVEYLPLYSERQRRRHEVKPGISGWAQVNGRNAISWEQKFEYDVWYVDHQTFWLDLKILFLTVIKVVRAEGISGANTMTMEKFRGSE